MIVAGRDKHRRQHKTLGQLAHAFALATDARRCHPFVLKWSGSRERAGVRRWRNELCSHLSALFYRSDRIS